MGNAATTQNGVLLNIPGSPNDIRNKKRLSFPGIFKPTKSPSFDADLGNILQSRRIDASPTSDADQNPESEENPQTTAEEVLSFVAVPFSQGRRKPQPVKASDPEERDDIHSEDGDVPKEPIEDDHITDLIDRADVKSAVDQESELASFMNMERDQSFSRSIQREVSDVIVESIDTDLHSDAVSIQKQQSDEVHVDQVNARGTRPDEAEAQLGDSSNKKVGSFIKSSASVPHVSAKLMQSGQQTDSGSEHGDRVQSTAILDAKAEGPVRSESGPIPDGKKIINPAVAALKKTKQDGRKSTSSLDSNGSRRSIRKQFSRGSTPSQVSSIESLRSVTNNNNHAKGQRAPSNTASIQTKDSEVFDSNIPHDLVPDASKPASAAASTSDSVESFARGRTQSSAGSYSSVRLKSSMKPMASEEHGMRRSTVKRAAAIAKYRMVKFNSTSTLFVDTTMVNADLQESLRYVALYLANIIRHNVSMGTLRTVEILSEKTHLLSRHIQFYHREPTEEEIFRFLECLFQSAELNVECVIITLIYIQRMLKNTSLTLQPINWARSVLGGVILASKVWDDHAVWNVDFCQIFPDVDVSDFNDLERFYMAAIHYDVSVRASTYAKYYFELRDLADTPSRPWALRPLARSETKKLEPKPQPPPPPPSQQKEASEENNAEEANDVLTESQAEHNLRTKRADRSMRRSHSDYQFVPADTPAFVM